MDAIRLEVFKHLFTSIAEEMGAALRKSSYSPNIKERRDYSCAVFDQKGESIAQAAHIPVHLGSMPLSVKAAVQKFPAMQPGEMILLNDPYQGGTHLPDLTLVAPVFSESNPGVLVGYVANRAHHADIGGMTPGSMPVATELYQEGLIIPPVRLVRAGEADPDLVDVLLANVRTPEERRGDLFAQIAANHRGISRLQQIAERYGLQTTRSAMAELMDYTERITRARIRAIPDGLYQFADYLDNDGIGTEPVKIAVDITIAGEHAVFDFTGSAPTQSGSINAVFAITLSAVYYVLRCLLPGNVPNNAGVLRPLKIITSPGSIVDARPPAAVAGGNVETSQRIVDVLLGALSAALPEIIPAASQGTMNNLTIGGRDHDRKPFTYYETIAGGMGARPHEDGLTGVHTHMTNTLNTPVEALEFAYPFIIEKYQIRSQSGGRGKYRGGNGLQRDIRLLVPAQVTLLTERRVLPPYGLNGGQPGSPGINLIISEKGETQKIAGKGTFALAAGSIISIQTPGGGGFGNPEEENNNAKT